LHTLLQLRGGFKQTFRIFSDSINRIPARAAASNVKGGATEQMNTFAWLTKSARTVLLDSTQATVIVSPVSR
jgi:hypothetical protein